ncbi:NAD-dependent epimerase/dehydratase family protein [Photobacterium sp. Hal280]|uniref:NAD-dependent epimerase/dehydratase family protein n=1 Tax=Photobacterium sp. Hal280 TaxID=3035163 RepID=UPI00301DB19C
MGRYTIFGGSGFVGSHLVETLKLQGHDVFIPKRNDESVFRKELGTVVYCSGCGDCKNTPMDVLSANTELLAKVLKYGDFSRLVYLSSTRVYMNNQDSDEVTDVVICSDDNRRLFNITKLCSEELALKSGRDVVIVRPSNIYGVALNSPLFLPSIARNAVKTGKIDMYITPEYTKDYVSVEDVVEAIIYLSNAESAIGQIVNIASGYNTSASKIAEALVDNTGCEVVWHDINYPREFFPETKIEKLINLMPHYTPRDVIEDMKGMISEIKRNLK